MVTKYGVIGDVHSNVAAFDTLVEKLLKEDVDKFVLNGDIGDNPIILNYVLHRMGETGKPAYVQFGSHEMVSDAFYFLDSAKKIYDNLIDVTENRYIEEEGHNLAFLPGSDSGVMGGGQFIQDYINFDDGIYLRINDDGNTYLQKVSRSQLDIVRRFNGAENDLRHISNIDSLDDIITDAEKTIVFNHIPCRFEKEGGVDYAHFLQHYALQKDEDGNEGYAKMGMVPAIAKDAIKKQGQKIIEMSEHNDDEQKMQDIITSFEKDKVKDFYIERNAQAGNPALREKYQKLNVSKVISNHIHEAGHNAHDWEENRIKGETYAPSLFYNPGCAAEGKAGIVMVDGSNVAYKNIEL